MIKYRAFIKVIETGNITKAAKELGYSQPGISHMINSLEKELGFQLLIRNRDFIQPTEDGKRILECCYKIINEENRLKETAQSINGVTSGTIRIGALNSMLVNFIPETVHEFSVKFPNIETIIHEFSVPELCEALQKGNIDIAFTTDDIPQGFEFLQLFEDPLCLAVHKNHPFAGYEIIPVSYLNGCDFIMPSPGWDELVTMIMKKHPFTPTTRHYVASDTVGISMVSASLGVFVISSLQKKLLSNDVVTVSFKEKITRKLGICVKSFKHVTPALSEFITVTHGMI